MIALIQLTPLTILQIFPGPVASFHLPSGDSVGGAPVGWTGEGCAIVSVVSFAPPDGQQVIGAPIYAFDGGGNVVENYATMPLPVAPAPSPADLAQAALDASDTTAIRCFKAGVAFPAEWLTYVTALRAIVKSNTGALPTRPAYPAGT